MFRRIPSRYALYAGDSNYSLDMLRYFKAGNITSPTEKAAVKALIMGLKSAGIYSKLERLWLCSPTSAQAALLDYITLESMTNSGATFTTNGWSFPGTGFAAIDTGWNGTFSTKVGSNNCSFGANVYSGTASGSKALFGVTDGTDNIIRIICQVSGSNLIWTYSAPGGTQQAQFTVNSSTETRGFRVVSRTGNRFLAAYQNGCAYLASSTAANTASFSIASMALGGYYDDGAGSTGLVWNGIINLAFVGQGLRQDEVQTFDELQAAYHFALGRYNYVSKASTYFTNASIDASSFTERYAANRFIGEMEARNLWSSFSRVYLVSPTSKTAARTCAKTGNLMTDVNTVYYDAINGFGFNGSNNLLRADAATNTMTEITTNGSHMLVMFNDPTQYAPGPFAGQDNGTDAFALGGDFLA